LAELERKSEERRRHVGDAFKVKTFTSNGTKNENSLHSYI
jgi:hypothetical protein